MLKYIPRSIPPIVNKKLAIVIGNIWRLEMRKGSPLLAFKENQSYSPVASFEDTAALLENDRSIEQMSRNE